MNSSSNKSRRGERRAVNAARTFFEEYGLVFQEIDLRNDVGKDAILDLARSGPDMGLSIALQIKGGKKYKRKTGHAISIDARLRRVWTNSSLPIYVIVLDSEDGELYWGDLAQMTKHASSVAKTVQVSPDARLTPDGLEKFLKAARLECLTRRGDPLLNLTSAEPGLLQSALFDCLVLGRRDPRYLRLIRYMLPSIDDQESFSTAIHVLAHATSHPDIFWMEDNIISEDARREIRKSFRWAPNEIAMLLARLPYEQEWWGRGTVGQSLYYILTSDPSLEWSIDHLITASYRTDELTWLSCWVKGPPFAPSWVRTDREAIVMPSLLLSLYIADDPQARFNEILERLPPVRHSTGFFDLADIISEFGGIDIF